MTSRQCGTRQYFVYIVANSRHRLYVGVTNDLVRRVYEHKHKLTRGFASKYNMDMLMYYETTDDVESAIAREKQVKGWLRERPAWLRAEDRVNRVHESTMARPVPGMVWVGQISDGVHGQETWSLIRVGILHFVQNDKEMLRNDSLGFRLLIALQAHYELFVEILFGFSYSRSRCTLSASTFLDSSSPNPNRSTYPTPGSAPSTSHSRTRTGIRMPRAPVGSWA